jgi:hypothetical protein
MVVVFNQSACVLTIAIVPRTLALFVRSVDWLPSMRVPVLLMVSDALVRSVPSLTRRLPI